MNFMQKKQEYLTWNRVIRENSEKELLALGKEGYYKKMVLEGRSDSDDILTQAKNWILTKFFEKNQQKYILEVGCGVGEMAYKLESIGNVVLGIDSSEDKMAFCKSLLREYPNKQIDFMLMNGIRTPFLDKFFDIVFSCQVIEHFISPSEIFKEMARLAHMVCGIIHMSESEEANPLHTIQFNRELVEYYLNESFPNTFQVDYIMQGGKDVFGVFVARSPTIGYPLHSKTFLDLRVQKCFSGYLSPIGYKKIDITEIEQSFKPETEYSKKIINEYLDSLELSGSSCVESILTPITVGYNPIKKKFFVVRDGNHRVYALKQYGKIREVNAYVMELKGY